MAKPPYCKSNYNLRLINRYCDYHDDFNLNEDEFKRIYDFWVNNKKPIGVSPITCYDGTVVLINWNDVNILYMFDYSFIPNSKVKKSKINLDDQLDDQDSEDF